MFSRNSLSAAILAATFASVGCSSGGGSGTSVDPTSTAITLSGTAAAGAPLVGQVTVKGALGNTSSAYIEADGTYDVDVSDLTAPYRLRAEGSVGGRTYKLHSYAEAADTDGTVNITPFTDLIIANAAQQLASNFFDSTTTTELSTADVEAQEEALQAKLQNVFDALGLGTAIDLLNQSFSADHSGLDAALDIINISVDENLNQATITNLVEGSSIIDDVLDADDNTDTVTVTDPGALTTAVNDTQAIANIFNNLNSAFSNGLPAYGDIEGYFADSYYTEDMNKSLFLTDITTAPELVGLTFGNTSVKNLDSAAGTAEVTFNVSINGVVDPRPETWLAVKDSTLGWQLDGDQRIVDSYFHFHCNDYDATDSYPGSCGINTFAEDNDFTNNGTSNVAIASATVTVKDANDSAKAVVYLGTPLDGSAGELQIYNKSSGIGNNDEYYSGDWKGFGTGINEIDSGVFVEGDTIELAVYTQDLDITDPTAPQIAVGASPVQTYTQTLLFAPAAVGKYPSATAETQTAINNFALGDNLTVGWTLAEGTVSKEVLVIIEDSAGNRLEEWVETWGDDDNSVTFASNALDATAASTAGLDVSSGYELRVRIYAIDPVTGQQHSRDYTANTSGSTGGSSSSLVCGYESGWDDINQVPLNPNSFADYETVVTDCGTAAPFTAADIAGTSVAEDQGEVITFDNTVAAATSADPESGNIVDAPGATPILFEWYVEAASCTGCTHNYLVIYSNSSIDSNLTFSFRETAALTGVTGTPGVSGAVYTFIKYFEHSSFGDVVRNTGSDGEIWTSTGNTVQ